MARDRRSAKGSDPSVPANLIWVLRLLVLLHTLIVLAQAVSAGTFLDGEPSALRVHQLTGTSVITIVSVLQLIVAVLCWRRHQRAAWFALAAFGLFAADMVQIGLGFTDQLMLHVPVGVAIFGVSLTLLFASVKHFEPAKGTIEPA
jgi:hypothetical protein